ncbi:GNAT family N-acetyltransferase [Streptomyces cyaneofuscatus]|uniref:GNAT family N-acetyltransferase n=1 Tax=Streptomyces cyaneofuscatus TaxID=66883 RepID=UPI0036D913CA
MHGGTHGPGITLTAGTLLMRPWREEDVPALLEAYDDPVMRQWVRLPVSTPEEAARWLELQHEGWESGSRFSFAVTDPGRGGELVGNLALKRPGPRVCPADQGRIGRGVWCGASQGAGTSSSRSDSGVSATPRGAVPGVVDPAKIRRTHPSPERAEVGYWTAARARGRGVAPRALEALTDWAFTAFAGEGLVRLELLHQVDNVASCRVAEKAGYAFAELLSALPPEFPLDGHLHVREASLTPDGVVVTQRAPGVSPAGSSDSR